MPLMLIDHVSFFLLQWGKSINISSISCFSPLFVSFRHHRHHPFHHLPLSLQPSTHSAASHPQQSSKYFVTCPLTGRIMNSWYECEECGTKRQSQTKIDIHKREIHTGEKPYKCQSCNYASAQTSNDYKHIWRLHTSTQEWTQYGDYAFVCPYPECDLKYHHRTRYELLGHRRHSLL